MRLSDLLAEYPHLDHEIDLEDGDVPSDLVSLLRVVRLDDTNEALLVGASPMGGITQYGLICTARLEVESGWAMGRDDED